MRPATTTPSIDDRQPFNLSTALIAVHKDCFTALSLTDKVAFAGGRPISYIGATGNARLRRRPKSMTWWLNSDRRKKLTICILMRAARYGRLCLHCIRSRDRLASPPSCRFAGFILSNQHNL
jgi:hypothetical protein